MSSSGERFKRCLGCNDRLLDQKEQYCSSCMFHQAGAVRNKGALSLASESSDPFSKIGGVLYIVGAILFLGIFINAVEFYGFYQRAQGAILGHWPFLFCFVGYVINLALVCYTSFLFIRKKKKTKTIFILFASFNLAFHLCMLSILYFYYRIPLDKDLIKELMRSLGFAVIWISYFLLSERVKHTFVH